MREANLYTLSRLSELHFVYAAFFAFGDSVYIKLGHSARPYRAICTLAKTAPWCMSHAVVSHIGSQAMAIRFERLAFHRLSPYRLRGDWFRFHRSDGETFGGIMRLTFAELTGRRLHWQRVALAGLGAPACVRPSEA